MDLYSMKCDFPPPLNLLSYQIDDRMSMLEVNATDANEDVENMQKMFDMLFKMSMERDEADRNQKSLERVLEQERTEIKVLKARFSSLSEDARRLEDERDRLMHESTRE